MVKKILGISCAVLVTLLWVKTVDAKEYPWPTGKKFAYDCVKNGGCDLDITSLTEQPYLFIGKSHFQSNNKVVNVADDGPKVSPNSMLGVWGNLVNDQYKFEPHCGPRECVTFKWSEKLDTMIRSTDSDDGRSIFLNEKFKDEMIDARYLRHFRHSIPISYLLQTGQFDKVKDGMVKGAQGDWLKVLEADKYLYKSSNAKDFALYGVSLNWFYPTIIPLIEAHIILQRNNAYTQQEYELVHNWLEKRVWALEHGPMDGLLSSRWRWKPFFESGNHETIYKKVAYLLWGVADQNEDYFTAGLNGFKDFHNTIRRNGSLKGEHIKGNGENYGINSGNKVAQGLIVMSVVLHNQGYDIEKDFPGIKRLVEYCSKLYHQPRSKLQKLGGGNNNLRFMTDDPNYYNTVGWLYLYDTVFNTDYAKDVPYEARGMVMFGISDAGALNSK